MLSLLYHRNERFVNGLLRVWVFDWSDKLTGKLIEVRLT